MEAGVDGADGDTALSHVEPAPGPEAGHALSLRPSMEAKHVLDPISRPRSVSSRPVLQLTEAGRPGPDGQPAALAVTGASRGGRGPARSLQPSLEAGSVQGPGFKITSVC